MILICWVVGLEWVLKLFVIGFLYCSVCGSEGYCLFLFVLIRLEIF